MDHWRRSRPTVRQRSRVREDRHGRQSGPPERTDLPHPHTLAGDIDTVDGRHLAFRNHAGVKDIEGVVKAGRQLGDLAALIQQDY